MNGDSTPWRVPKPNPIAFASSGSLPKKHQNLNERLNLPVLATPETPLKKERSKFIVPANLSPFAYSPHNLAPGGNSSSRSRTNLSKSFVGAQEDSSVNTSGSNIHSLTRSSSPVPLCRDSQMDEDIFGAAIDDNKLQTMSEADPFSNDCKFSASLNNLNQNFEDEDELITTPHGSLPWKSKSPTFFPKNYFNIPDFQFKALENTSFSVSSEFYSGDYFEDNFEIVETLGHGSFSDVFKVKSKSDGSIFAMKRSKNPFTGFVDRNRRLQEVRNMWLISGHPHCIQILNSWEQNGILYVLMELCDNGSLSDVISYMAHTNARFTEYQVWQILKQVATGLECIHHHGIVHLDIKPANVLIDQFGILKIGDFGLANIVGELHDADMEGDKYYMAPETLEGRYDKPADIFSLGLLILELATDVELPAQGDSWQNLRHGDFSELSFEDVSDALNSLIKDMTDPDPLRRPTIQDILLKVDAYTAFMVQDEALRPGF